MAEDPISVSMDKIAAEINDLLQIKDPNDPEAPSSMSRVDDIVDDRLLIAWPTEGGVFVPIHDHQSLTISFVRDDAIYTFTGIVEELTRDVIHRITVRPASPAERIQRRQFFRAKLVIPVDFTLQDLPTGETEPKPQAVSFRATTYDISGSGLSIRYKKSLPSGALLEAKFTFPGDDHVIKVVCQVVHCTNLSAASEAAMYHIGIRFLAINEACRTQIVRHVFRSQTDHKT